MKLTVELNSEVDTDELGRLLAEHLPIRCIVALNGTLGAGKTRLSQAIAKACAIPVSEVTSPTFTLWQTYHGNRTIHHLDAYRIGDEDEFDALGVEECFDAEAVTLIEWASRVEACLPADAKMSILLEVTGDQQRLATIASDLPEFELLCEEMRRSSLQCE